jgi:hypothetical protein
MRIVTKWQIDRSPTLTASAFANSTPLADDAVSKQTELPFVWRSTIE